MNTKVKILSSALSIGAIIGCMGYGVYAATSPTFGTGSDGKVEFLATGVYADITGKITAQNRDSSELPADYFAKNYSLVNGNYSQSESTFKPNWNIGTLDFEDDEYAPKTWINYQIKIKNVSSYPIIVGFNSPEEIKGVSIKTTYGVEKTTITTGVEIAAESEEIFDVTLTLKDFGTSIIKTEHPNVSFGFTMIKK